MTEKLRFNEKINNVVISQQGDRFFASFSMEITQEEYNRTHKTKSNTNNSLGIDLGVKNYLTLSNGLQIQAPKPLNKLNRRIVRLQRQLNKKQHAKSKQEALQGVKKSNNYKKASLRLNKLYTKISNTRSGFLHKLASGLVANVDHFCLENLNVRGMMKNHKLARAISDVSFYEFKRMLEYKSKYNGRNIYYVDRYYPSSKTCSNCGNIKKDLTLADRTYFCLECGLSIDRDYNASLNLLSQLSKHIGQVLPEFTPADLTALLEDLAINQITTSKVETGIQQKLCL